MVGDALKLLLSSGTQAVLEHFDVEANRQRLATGTSAGTTSGRRILDRLDLDVELLNVLERPTLDMGPEEIDRHLKRATLLVAVVGTGRRAKKRERLLSAASTGGHDRYRSVECEEGFESVLGVSVVVRVVVVRLGWVEARGFIKATTR